MPHVLDTGVFSAHLAPAGRSITDRYASRYGDEAMVVSFATVAELRFGARRADWGPRRLADLDALFGRARVVWPGPALLATYVALRAECATAGHGLAAKIHEADRWIAATAIQLDLSLISTDSIFRGVPGLELEALG